MTNSTKTDATIPADPDGQRTIIARNGRSKPCAHSSTSLGSRMPTVSTPPSAANRGLGASLRSAAPETVPSHPARGGAATTRAVAYIECGAIVEYSPISAVYSHTQWPRYLSDNEPLCALPKNMVLLGQVDYLPQTPVFPKHALSFLFYHNFPR